MALPPALAWAPGLEEFEDGQHEEAQFVNGEVPEVEPSVNEPSVVVELVEL